MLNFSTLWVDSTFAPNAQFFVLIYGVIRLRHSRPEAVAVQSGTCSLKTEERTKKPVREAHRSFLRPERQPSIPPPTKGGTRTTYKKNMKDNVFSIMRHMFCASQVTRKPLRPWLSIRTPCQELQIFEVQGNATDFKDRKI